MAGLQDIMQALGQGGQPQGNLGRVNLDYLGGTQALQNQLKSLSPEMQQLIFPLGLQQGLGPRPLQNAPRYEQGLLPNYGGQ
jgi:hypothetical protein